MALVLGHQARISRPSPAREERAPDVEQLLQREHETSLGQGDGSLHRSGRFDALRTSEAIRQSVDGQEQLHVPAVLFERLDPRALVVGEAGPEQQRA